jgi:hypothetical protein
MRVMHPQNVHFALPSRSTSAWVDRPQSRHLQLRKEFIMARLSRRKPATGGHDWG